MVMYIANVIANHLVVEGIRVAATVTQRYALMNQEMPVEIHLEKEKRVQGIIVISRLGFGVGTNNAAILHKSGSQLDFSHADVEGVV